MRRFSTEEVIMIMSPEHRNHTAWALQKHPDDVTSLDLVVHWMSYHIVPILHFNVESLDEKTPHGEDELMFHPV